MQIYIMNYKLLLLLLLLMTGCQGEKAALTTMPNSARRESTSITSDPKPLYREVTDELGVKKGWSF